VTASWRSRLQNLALLLLSSGCLLSALELAARVERAGRGGGRERNERLQYMEWDPRLGWRMRPGARVVYDRREYEVEVEVNALGLRDVPRDPDQRRGGRVLALGDSFVEAYSVALDAALTRVAERSLPPHCPAEVWNAGVGGYSTAQEYLFYVDRGRRWAPDVVLLFFYYNDVLVNARDNYWGTPVPLLEERDGKLAVVNEPVPRPVRREPAAAQRPTAGGSAAFDWFAERLRLGAPRAYDRLARLGLWDPLGGDRVEDAFKVYRRRAAQVEIEQAWERTHRILEELARAVEADGARFAVVYVPSRMEVSNRDWELTRRRYSLDAGWDRTLVVRRLGEIAREVRFPLVDLTPDLARAEAADGEVYFRIDGHWNARGHRAAGEAVARALPALLPGCAPSRSAGS
jgi:hypothetical protein